MDALGLDTLFFDEQAFFTWILIHSLIRLMFIE